MIHIDPQAEPFCLPGDSDTALLFIHGFTASPSEILPTAKLIHQNNRHTISGILLPGHGSSARYLQDTTWQDWYAAVQKELLFLLEKFARVFIAGLSLGALLALHAAREFRAIKGVIVINAPIYNKFPLLTASAPIMRVVKPYYPKKDKMRFRELAAQGRFAYEVTPVKAFLSMLCLRQQIMGEMNEIKAPLLVFQALKDESVHRKSADFLLQNAVVTTSRIVELPLSEHVATMGPEKEIIAQEIGDFIQRIP